jgi:ribosomal protein S26
MPDGAYMTPKDGVYHPTALTPEDIKAHSLICNVFCKRCNTYIPPHTAGRHFNNREAMETEAILLMGNATVDKEDFPNTEFIFCWDCKKAVPQGLAKKSEKDKGRWVCCDCKDAFKQVC